MGKCSRKRHLQPTPRPRGWGGQYGGDRVGTVEVGGRDMGFVFGTDTDAGCIGKASGYLGDAGPGQGIGGRRWGFGVSVVMAAAGGSSEVSGSGL